MLKHDMENLLYWSNACGELHYHGERDINPDELPKELKNLYFGSWSDSHGVNLGFWNDSYGVNCYLAEYHGQYGISLECEYSSFYAEEYGKTYDELLEMVKKGAVLIAASNQKCITLFDKDSLCINDGSKTSQLVVFVPYADNADKYEPVFNEALRLLKKVDNDIYEYLDPVERPKQTVVIINGKGGVGKDTLVEYARKEFAIMNVSSIDPVKQIARECGWYGEKTEKARKFLSDLKKLLIDYNDMPNTHCYNEYQTFASSRNQILFVHIREPEEIKKYQTLLTRDSAKCVTLLVTREGVETGGNTSDEGVENYNYDYRFDNTGDIQENGERFISLLKNILN